MAQVLAFPGAQRVPVQQAEQAPTDADVRPEGHTAEEPAKPAEVKPPVYVRIRADVFQGAMEALDFYAGQGWDGGKKARKFLNDAFAPEPPAA